MKLEKVMLNKSNKEIQFIETEDIKIPENANVKVATTSKRIIISYSTIKCCNLRRYKRLSKFTYLNLDTGEVKQYNSNDLKKQKELLKNLKRFKDIVILNFNEFTNAKFITVTLNQEFATTDLSTMKQYAKNFFRRLKYKLSKEGYDIAYVVKYEQHENGVWHIHIILKDENNKQIWIEKASLDKCWGMGHTYIENITNGFIYESYFGIDFNDMENSSTMNIASYISKPTQLYNVKCFERIWGCSKNIERPRVENMRHIEALKQVKDENAMLERTKTLDVYKGGKKINTHKKMIFGRKKKK